MQVNLEWPEADQYLLGTRSGEEIAYNVAWRIWGQWKSVSWLWSYFHGCIHVKTHELYAWSGGNFLYIYYTPIKLMKQFINKKHLLLTSVSLKVYIKLEVLAWKSNILWKHQRKTKSQSTDSKARSIIKRKRNIS